jgi:hypothetical protein
VQGFKEQIFSGDTRFGMETLLARDTFSFARYAPSACRAQLEVRFRGEADIDRQAKLAGSVENDPNRT